MPHVTPEKYIPRTAERMKDVLAEAICRRIDRDKLTTSDIARRYSSIRAADVAAIKRGDHRVFGLNRLASIAEAVGVDACLVVAA